MVADEKPRSDCLQLRWRDQRTLRRTPDVVLNEAKQVLVRLSARLLRGAERWQYGDRLLRRLVTERVSCSGLSQGRPRGLGIEAPRLGLHRR